MQPRNAIQVERTETEPYLPELGGGPSVAVLAESLGYVLLPAIPDFGELN